MPIRWLVVCFLTMLLTWPTHAGAVTLSGYFDDSTNTALAGNDLGPALFTNDNAIANNVALYALTVSSADTVTFESKGWTAFGAEPYFSLFQGLGSSATFIESNFFDPNIDFLIMLPLAAGDYTIALGVWVNMSFAENNGVGSVGDGFTGLGDPNRFGNYYYELEVTSLSNLQIVPSIPNPSPNPIPEPASLLLWGSGIAGLVGMRKWLGASHSSGRT